MMHIQDMPGVPPWFMLLVALNAPVALPRALLFRYLPGWWDPIVFVTAIGVLWYWVALNIETLRTTREIVIFSWTPLRLAIDVIVVGVNLIWLFLLGRDRFSLPVTSTDWIWSISSMLLLALWSAAMVAFFGRDFIHCLLHPRVKPANSQLA